MKPEDMYRNLGDPSTLDNPVKPEWMPVNPCIECGKIHPCECAKWWIYQGAIEYQKKLLEYQRNQVMATPLGVNHHYFEFMLKEMEVTK